MKRCAKFTYGELIFPKFLSFSKKSPFNLFPSQRKSAKIFAQKFTVTQKHPRMILTENFMFYKFLCISGRFGVAFTKLWKIRYNHASQVYLMHCQARLCSGTIACNENLGANEEKSRSFSALIFTFFERIILKLERANRPPIRDLGACPLSSSHIPFSYSTFVYSNKAEEYDCSLQINDY